MVILAGVSRPWGGAPSSCLSMAFPSCWHHLHRFDFPSTGMNGRCWPSFMRSTGSPTKRRRRERPFEKWTVHVFDYIIDTALICVNIIWNKWWHQDVCTRKTLLVEVASGLVQQKSSIQRAPMSPSPGAYREFRVKSVEWATRATAHLCRVLLAHCVQCIYPCHLGVVVNHKRWGTAASG